MAFESVDSTNALALEQAHKGDDGQLWITANQQTNGKGRRGRPWVSKAGNLYASLLLIDPAPSEALVTLPMVIALALHKAIVSLEPKLADDLKIKWPNDLLLDGKKLSGILLEAARLPEDRLAVVVGIGVNCLYYPQDAQFCATSLREFGTDLPAEKLFPAIACAVRDELRIWAKGAGFSITRKEWLARSCGLGEQIIARFDDHEISGTFNDIDQDGFLLLMDEGHIQHRISAADIFFGKSSKLGA